jgi:hypothetical protein
MTTKCLPVLASEAEAFNPSPEEAPVTTHSFLVPILRPPNTLGTSFPWGIYNLSGSSVVVRALSVVVDVTDSLLDAIGRRLSEVLDFVAWNDAGAKAAALNGKIAAIAVDNFMFQESDLFSLLCVLLNVFGTLITV